MEKELKMPYDVLAGIFYYLNKENKKFGTKFDLHKKIYNLKQNQKYDLLEVFDFSTDGMFPVSGEIEDSLYSLRLSHMITFINPYYVQIELKKKSEKVIKENVLNNIFSKDEIKELKEIAKQYEDSVEENNDPGRLINKK